MKQLKKGYVQVYTGNGKGKSTAAFGLAFRAAGSGLRVFIAQFAKGRECGEHRAVEKFPEQITLRHYGCCKFITGKPSEKDLAEAHKCLRECRNAIVSGGYEVVILDEANVAVHLGLISIDELLEMIAQRPEHVELVITGRHADEEVMKRADLVTEMVDRKHYHKNDVQARKGIEY